MRREVAMASTPGQPCPPSQSSPADPSPPATHPDSVASGRPPPRLRRAHPPPMLPPIPPGDLLDDDPHARPVWQFVPGARLSALDAPPHAVASPAGRPPPHPPALVG